MLKTWNNITKAKYQILVAIALLVFAEVLICFFRSHFIVSEQESRLFIYSYNFFEQFISFPSLGQWNWQGDIMPGGIARYCEIFFIQFYYLKYGAELINLPLIILIFFCWQKISVKLFKTRKPILSTVSVLFYLWLMLSPVFPQGILAGYIINTLAISALSKINGRILQGIIYPPLSAILFYATGMPAALLFVLFGILPLIRNRNYWSLAGIIPLFFIPAIFSKIYYISVEDAINKNFFTEWKNKSITKEWIASEKIKSILYKNPHTPDIYAQILQIQDKFLKETSVQTPVQNIDFFNCLKNALIFSGELNNKFFSYGKYTQMAHPLPAFTPDVTEPVQNFLLETGQVSQAQHEEMSRVEITGVSPLSLKKILRENKTQNRNKLNNKYLYLAKQSLFYQNIAANTPAAVSNPINFTVIAARQWQIKGVMSAVKQAYRQNPAMPLLDLVIMQDLLDKNIDSVISKIPMYKELGYSKPDLPVYIQEALLIAGVNPASKYFGYNFSQATLKNFANFTSAVNAYRAGRLSPEEITVRFQDGFFFYFYFGMLIETQ